MIDPVRMSYLQSTQSNQQQPMQEGGFNAPSLVNNGGAPKNPFDVGISRAIESARESLGMTQKQQDKALRSSMLSFANNISQQPKQRGFFNNFASIGRALAPAIATHDQEEEAALGQNNDLANQILKYQGQEQDRQAEQEHRDWQRQYAEAQLGESRRNHDLMGRFRRDSLESRTSGPSKYEHEAQQEAAANQDLNQILDDAEALILESGNKAHRGFFGRFGNKLTPGGIPLDESQAALNAAGDVLRGKLFNAWGYRNQAEFEHVPSISADNSPESNLAIIKQLKGLVSKSQSRAPQGMLPQSQISNTDQPEEDDLGIILDE